MHPSNFKMRYDGILPGNKEPMDVTGPVPLGRGPHRGLGVCVDVATGGDPRPTQVVAHLAPVGRTAVHVEVVYTAVLLQGGGLIRTHRGLTPSLGTCPTPVNVR